MDRTELIHSLRAYNRTLSGLTLTALEKQYTWQIDNRDYFYGFSIDEPFLPGNTEEFLVRQKEFKGLLKEHHGKLCNYLTHIQEYTCNDELIRMDVRSRDFSRYRRKIFRAIGSFYLFYGADLSMKELVYGTYRDLLYNAEFCPVIAEELLEENQEVIQYCRDVLTSENNTAVLTRDVIAAIEQSHNKELQQMLTQVLLAAKLQEGLRQSVLETVDENNLEYFMEIIEVIERENLLRFSSVQRAVLTWIGIGYAEVKEKDVRYIFERIRRYFQDEEIKRAAFLNSENPLDIYLALYCTGVYDVDAAMQRAGTLLADERRYVIASALIYMKLTCCFDVKKYLDFPEKYKDDEWILALFYSECVRAECGKCGLGFWEARKLYDCMEAFLPLVGARKTWSSKGFEWFSVTLYKEGLCYCMLDILDAYPGRELVERYLPYAASVLTGKKLDDFMEKHFRLASEEARKAFMVKEIISSNDGLGQWIEKEYRHVSLAEEDIMRLEGRLKTRKAKARAHIVNVLASQSEEMVRKSYGRLMQSSVKTIRESALELRSKVPEEWIEEQDEPAETGVLQGKESGFGMYTPNTVCKLPYRDLLTVRKKGLFKKTEVVDISFLLPWSKAQVLGYFRKWDARIICHENDEYYTGHEYRQVKDQVFYPVDYKKHTLEAMPLSEVWRAYFEEDSLTSDIIFEIRFLMETISDEIYWEKVLKVESDFFTLSGEDVKGFRYYSHFARLFGYYYQEIEQKTDYSEKAAAFLQMIIRYSKGKNYQKKNWKGEVETHSLMCSRSVWFMREKLGLMEVDDEVFKQYFPIVLGLYNEYTLGTSASVQSKMMIEPMVLARAVHLGMVPKELLYEGLLDRHMDVAGPYHSRRDDNQLFEAYRDAYYEGKGIWGKPHFNLDKYQGIRYKEVYECLRDALDEIADRLLSMEAGRLNEKTVVTDLVRQLSVVRGAEYLALALRVLDGEKLCRQTNGSDRAEVFSNVIRHCYPKPGDDLSRLIQQGVSEERLVEVAMLAPQWIDGVNEVLKWDGFKEACYYFSAHMKQYDFKEKKAEIAKYTELEPEDLYDGAFDMQWCRQVYETLGEKRFQMIYKASKFLCENSFHTRARKYADACLGKADKESLRKQVEEKRNKDALNAYCICPIEDDADLLERYLYVQQFVKESRQYGAQRQASEKRAAEMALLNLARNSRFETVTRLSWMMESEVVQQNAGVLKPQKIEAGNGEIEVWIEIDEQGGNEICVRKNGKHQKSIPAALKKNEQVLVLKEIHNQWNEQYRRSRMMLQQAMEERSELSREELEVIMQNPIVSPMMAKLVLISGGCPGFYEDGKLRTLGEAVDFGGTVRIAHPYDLYECGCWHEYQRLVFDKKIVQPFKQVFRELYLKLDEELDAAETRRYSGYQIQTKKAAAALKGRKWNVSYETGLERVYYKENLVVNLFADADWFSPSDIEAPSIEYVAFYSRKDGRQVLIKNIDAVTFSETMRDVDLAVSTAFVGGVDPVTSFSTMELRRTIVEFTCRLMKLDNVTVQEHFANVKGSLNDYSIHLGSGVVHQAGGAAIHMIAVHSQKRGKVYLPFLDEDPKTAEILSKIVLLAEDYKLKDPAILKQIHTMK